VGCLRAATGLGESARLCYEALTRTGLDVRAIDVSSILFQTNDLFDYQFRDGGNTRGRATLVVHVNAPLMPLVLLALGRKVIRDKWIVGYWAWELPEVPREWDIGACLVHEIWVPSQFVAAAVGTRIKNVPIRVLPHPVALTANDVRAPSHPIDRFLTGLIIFDMGSSFERKNPIAGIEAFRRALGDSRDARLIVKVTNSGLFPEGERKLRAAVARLRNAMLIDRTLQRDEISTIYAQSDFLLSLHRAEGFGLTIVEAMLRGIPALSTNWSGPTDFITPATGYPIEYQLIHARDPQGTYDHPEQYWAEPDVAAAAEALRRHREESPMTFPYARRLRSFSTSLRSGPPTEMSLCM
jgi:glycosyltransferase involved in cell wall biosynthesis